MYDHTIKIEQKVCAAQSPSGISRNSSTDVLLGDMPYVEIMMWNNGVESLPERRWVERIRGKGSQ